MPQGTSAKFRTAKKIVKTGESTDPSQKKYEVNLITYARVNAVGSGRLLSPLEAERRRNRLLAGKHEGSSSIRKMRRPVRTLTLKPAPALPTAPKNPIEIKRNFLRVQLKQHIESIDRKLLAVVALLAGFGILAVYSATLSYGQNRYVIIQSVAAVLGIVLMTALSFIDYRQFAKKYRLVILLNVALLLFTYVFGEGVTDKTNANWINLGFIKIQPSEFAKILFIYAFAAHLYFVRDRINKFFTAMTLFLHAAIIIGLTFLQKDLGTLTIFLFIFAVMCFAGNLNIWYFIAGIAGIVAASPFIWTKLNYFQKQRILAPYDISIDPNAIGVRHQAVRSMTAISLGGIDGSGYMHGKITQGNFSAKHTDMIFATICEEFGFIGALVIIGLYIFLVVRIILVAIRSENTFGCLVCTGVAAMFVIQIIENIGMCLGILPVIGITLPFLSYGGSSALSTYIAIGLVLSVSTHKEQTFFGR
ncbi:MAG: FtsW/RodA/SpoVE family cell cycle protein [Eubacteriales bacterium]|jgi:rod shape determining protein RodA